MNQPNQPNNNPGQKPQQDQDVKNKPGQANPGQKAGNRDSSERR